MKTKIALLFLILFGLTSCIKDFIGNSGNSDKVVLTSKNYLFEGNLEKFLLETKIKAIDDEIALLPENDPKIKTLLVTKSSLNMGISDIADISFVGKNFPVPCDLPGGKCVPTRLEYIVFSTIYNDALVVINSTNGDQITSSKLTPLPGFENQFQYAQIPIMSYGDKIIVKIVKKDGNGIVSSYEVNFPN